MGGLLVARYPPAIRWAFRAGVLYVTCTVLCGLNIVIFIIFAYIQCASYPLKALVSACCIFSCVEMGSRGLVYISEHLKYIE